jgi:hypothetical protein
MGDTHHGHNYYALQKQRHGVRNVSWRNYAKWIILHDALALATAPKQVLKALTPRQAVCVLLREGTTFAHLQDVLHAFHGTPQDLLQSLHSLWNAQGLRRVTKELLSTVPLKLISLHDDARLLLAWLRLHDFENVAYRNAFYNLKVERGKAVGLSAVVPFLQSHSGLLLYAACFGIYVGFAAAALRIL